MGPERGVSINLMVRPIRSSLRVRDARERRTLASRPIAVDLFAGAGGLSLGFEQAGFDVVAAVEIDPIHAAVHKFNFPDCAVLPISVTELSGNDIRIAAKIGDREVDVVCGGAPCQGFSMIGKRALDDLRNALVRDFVRIVRELDARAFVFENVKGITVGKHKQVLDEIVEEFQSIGYDVRTPTRVLNAANFGVPQHRERLFLMGVKRGIPIPVYPNPSTRRMAKGEYVDLPNVPNCADALGDLPEVDRFHELISNDEMSFEDWGLPSKFAREMRCIDASSWHFGHKREWDFKRLTSSVRTSHTDISRRRFSETDEGKVEPISRFFKLAAHGVSNTLRAGTDASRGAFTSPRPIHYLSPRCITVREMARLHGFPDWFRFHTTKWHGARQIGNAVPPPLARAVATSIMLAIGSVPRVSSVLQKLGDASLLKMGMNEASHYWAVKNPISGRDRKSGARKRSQHETEIDRLAKIAAE